jgi:hypothetical protein
MKEIVIHNLNKSDNIYDADDSRSYDIDNLIKKYNELQYSWRNDEYHEIKDSKITELNDIINSNYSCSVKKYKINLICQPYLLKTKISINKRKYSEHEIEYDLILSKLKIEELRIIDNFEHCCCKIFKNLHIKTLIIVTHKTISTKIYPFVSNKIKELYFTGGSINYNCITAKIHYVVNSTRILFIKLNHNKIFTSTLPNSIKYLYINDNNMKKIPFKLKYLLLNKK